jgi:hypothetical protein
MRRQPSSAALIPLPSAVTSESDCADSSIPPFRSCQCVVKKLQCLSRRTSSITKVERKYPFRCNFHLLLCIFASRGCFARRDPCLPNLPVLPAEPCAAICVRSRILSWHRHLSPRTAIASYSVSRVSFICIDLVGNEWALISSPNRGSRSPPPGDHSPLARSCADEERRDDPAAKDRGRSRSSRYLTFHCLGPRIYWRSG